MKRFVIFKPESGFYLLYEEIKTFPKPSLVLLQKCIDFLLHRPVKPFNLIDPLTKYCLKTLNY